MNSQPVTMNPPSQANDSIKCPTGLSRMVTLGTAAGLLGSFFLFASRPAPSSPQASPAAYKLSREQASALAQLALKGIQTEEPHYYLGSKRDTWKTHKDNKMPRDVHPAFYGCFDWHSAVHSHWTLVRVLRRFPDLPEKEAIRKALAKHLTAKNLQAEADYFAQPNRQGFERPYGWAWVLKLTEELHGWDDPDGKEWLKNLKPLTDTIVARYLAYFPTLTTPSRSGVHSNTAFGLAFAHDYARATGNKPLQDLVEERSRTYYAKDAELPAASEPGRADFFSPSLIEADLMRRILPPAEFQAWLGRCLPELTKGKPANLFQPIKEVNRASGQSIHLDGLNFSRAWCMANIAATLPPDDPGRKVLLEAAARHGEEALPHVASGNFAGEHWLPTYAVYLLSTRPPE